MRSVLKLVQIEYRTAHGQRGQMKRQLTSGYTLLRQWKAIVTPFKGSSQSKNPSYLPVLQADNCLQDFSIFSSLSLSLSPYSPSPHTPPLPAPPLSNPFCCSKLIISRGSRTDLWNQSHRWIAHQGSHPNQRAWFSNLKLNHLHIS